MPPSPYEPLDQEGDDFFQGNSSRTAADTAYPPRPETYYGDGPFDPPSSDDEAEVCPRHVLSSPIRDPGLQKLLPRSFCRIAMFLKIAPSARVPNKSEGESVDDACPGSEAKSPRFAHSDPH
ncbi:hypothetical protein C8Q80DRAFT_1213564 [Daedaleopsis nitida]|nr:hypothetical protein C8Q80DRAFT_1213564 [Daedaleopsis nitida]